MRVWKFGFFAIFCLAFLCSFAQEPIELAPGIGLPATGLVFVLDQPGNDKTLVQLHPTEIASNSHAASNFARSMVYANQHSSLELPDPRSSIRLRSANDAVFVRLGAGDDPEVLRNRVRIIRLQSTPNRRVVSSFSQNVFGGQARRRYEEIPVTKSDGPNGTWLKLTPQTPLAQGEYAVVFMPKDARNSPDTVYDFGVDSNQDDAKGSH